MINGFQTIIDILKTALAILPFLGLCFLSKKINLKKPMRNRQFLMPVFAFIFIIAVMIFMSSINTWLLLLIHKIIEWVNTLLKAEWMPEQVKDVLSRVWVPIKNFINGLDLSYWMFYISNTVAILAYFLYKRICISIMKRKFKKKNLLHDRVSGFFYEFFPERDTWCLRDKWVHTRLMFKVVYYTTIALASLLMLVSGRMYVSGLLAAVYYPVLGVIVIGELYFYLDGATRQEYSKDILGENEDAYKTVNYSLLRKYLRNLFTDKLLCENTGVNNALAYNVTNEELLEKLANDPDPKVVNFSTFYTALNRTGFPLDHTYLHSSLDLLKGKSIVFNNPFYQDLIPYAFYPMNRSLLKHNKVLLVLGRHAIENDIEQWIKDGIEAVTNIPFLWKTGVLGYDEQDLDIGIVTRSRVIDAKVYDANQAFLKQVGFMVIIEPSKLISTAQIGLNLLVKKCRALDEDKEIVYCMCDRNCDGIVDAMSHILMTSLTEVSATNKHLGTSSYMCWNADNEYLHHRLFPNISRYLGFGTELSYAALKNQVSKTYWYSGDAFPVTDIRWIDKQYYYDLMKYAALPTSQEAMDDYFFTSSNIWSAKPSKNNYFTVEDESYNMFEMLRNFATRSTEQGFINIISPNYLLKDYMAANDSIFEADAKAIPYLVADYARTRRNVILRMMLLMSISYLDEETAKKEFSLIGLPILNTRKQLWFEIYRCLSDIETITALPEDYRSAVKEVTDRGIPLMGSDHLFKIDIIKAEEKYNYEMGKMEIVYSITDLRFIERFVNELKSSSYVAEDEKGERYFLGSELSGHIYQKYLPGQFFTFDGKYYEMQYLTSDNQVLVRRAADHIHGRPEYRQLREYTISAFRMSTRIGAVKNINDLSITREYADIAVSTPGYYRLEKYNDLAKAKKVMFKGEQSQIPVRYYRNKQILKIDLPDMDGRFTPEVRYTITVLLNEVFRTLFADNQPYIIAVTDDSHLKDDAGCRPLTYSIKGEGVELSENSIFIIEDSQIDIGLLITVERNLNRIFEIIHDYLRWNKREIARSLKPSAEEKPMQIAPEDIGEYKPPKKENVFKRARNRVKKFFSKIASIFKRKKKKNDDPEVPKDELIIPQEPEIKDEDTPVMTPDMPEEEIDKTTDTPVGENPDDIDGEAQDIPEEEAVTESDEGEAEGVADPEQAVGENETEAAEENDVSAAEGNEDILGIPPETPANMPASGDEPTMASIEKDKRSPFDFSPEPYHKRYYLLYGHTGEPAELDTNAALVYLTCLGFDANPLRDARNGRMIAKYVEATFKPNKSNARYCDFCGNEIYGVEYETLSDGRDRCISCGRTAVKTEEEFKRIFEDVKRNLESFFGIKINTGIKVEMVNSQKLHRRLKKAFIPTPGMDGRVLGVAIKDKNGYSLLIENGSPRISAMLTIAHELTHIWQYLNWKDKQIKRQYGKALRLEIYEGMAKWVEIQYAYLINEPVVAKREEIITVNRNDEYGNGYIRYRANYPLSTGTVITRETPFMNVLTPLDPMYCGDVSVMIDPNNGARGYDGDEDMIDFDDFDDDEIDVGKISEKLKPTVTETYQRDPDSVPLYAYDCLSQQEKELYDRFYTALAEFETELTDLPGWVTQQDITKIRSYVLRDHPEIFWFNGTISFSYEKESGRILNCTMVYCMTREEADIRNRKIEEAISEFLSGVTRDMSDYEAALAVYRNIIDLVDYDSLKLERMGDKVSDDTPDDLRSIYGVFVERKAVCAGYAKATQYLLNRLGIECVYVSGEGDRGPHAWNLVRLSGEYYYIDVTWDDHSNTKEAVDSSREITYDYFCVTTMDILRDHTPDDTLPLPNCVSKECNYYFRNGLLIDHYSFTSVRSIIAGSVAKGEYTVPLKAADKDVYNKMYTSLIKEKKIGEIIQYLCLQPSTRVSTSYAYSNSEEKLKVSVILTKI